MKGSAVFRAAIRRLENAIIEQLKEFGFSTQDLAQVIAHQANARILAQLSRRLGLPKQALYTVIERYGNTSSASLPIALDVAVRENRLNRGDVVLLGAFGGGLTWATGLMRW
jgi:3-oxoacyl-[acyl-carrier-protein] synthase-3